MVFRCLGQLPDISFINDQASCISYTLPAIEGVNIGTNAGYYTEPNGGGIALDEGAVITESTFLYAFISTTTGADEECFQVFIYENSPFINDTIITACDFYILPPLPLQESLSDAYYTETGGKGQKYVPGQILNDSIILYQYSGQGDCIQQRKVEIRVSPSAVLLGSTRKYFCPYYVASSYYEVVPSFFVLLGDNDYERWSEPDSLWFIDQNTGLSYGKSDTIRSSGSYLLMARYGSCITAIDYELDISTSIDLPYDTDTVEVCSDKFVFPTMDIPGSRLTYKELSTNRDYRAGDTMLAFANGYHDFEVTLRNNWCADNASFVVDFLKTANSTDTVRATVCSGQVYPLNILRAHPTVDFDVDEVIPILPNDNVDGNQFDLHNIKPDVYDFYAISYSDERCFPFADTTIFSIKVVDDCMSADTTFIRCDGFAALKYTPDILGGAIYDVNFRVVSDRSTFSENIQEVDFLVNDARFVYRIITDQNGFSDTSVISLHRNTRELEIKVSQNELCYKECVEIEVDFLDIDEYRSISIWDEEEYFSAGRFFSTKMDNKTLRLCFDPEKAKARIKENHHFFTAFDTLYLIKENQIHQLGIRASAERCVSTMSNLTIETKDIPVRNISTTICSGESIEISGEVFDMGRTSGEVLLPSNDGSKCDSILNVSLNIDRSSHTFLNNTFEQNDTVFVRCNPYYKGNETDTLTLISESNRCDSIIFIDFKFESIVTFDTLDLCENDTTVLGSQLITESGEYTSTFKSTTGKDSIVNLVVTVLDQGFTDLMISTCDSIYKSPSGKILSESGLYIDTLHRADHICDSLIMIDILFEENTSDTFMISLQSGDGYEHMNTVYFAPDTLHSSFEQELGCDSVVVLILKRDSELSDELIALPNIFSPNGDEVNDVFRVETPSNLAATIETMKIFDRWGNVIWQITENSNDSVTWDGTQEGTAVPNGTYIVFLSIKHADGRIQKQVNDLTVVR